jgi:hypothetical protein
MVMLPPGISAAASGPSQANQAALEAETNEDTYAPPDLIKNSPGVAKTWVSITAAGLLETPDHGISTVGDTATGVRDVNYTTAFSSGVYAIANAFEGSAAGDTSDCISRTTGDVTLVTMDNAGTDKDLVHYATWHGDQ